MSELSTIARPYAEAAFAIASADNAGLDSWSKWLSTLADLAEMQEVKDVLSDPRLTTEQCITVFNDLLQEASNSTAAPASGKAAKTKKKAGTEVPAPIANFVTLLIENDRILLLPQISEQFTALRNKQEGSALAEITSAFPLSDEQVTQLVTVLEKKFMLKLKPSVTVDESLIGGVRVVVGDQVFDTSVQAQLTKMRDTLVA